MKKSNSSIFRHVRLLTIGTLIGTGFGASAFLYDWRVQPKYTAMMPFQVNMNQPPLSGSISRPFVPTDDTPEIMERQRPVFGQESYLLAVLDSDEFHPIDPKDPSRRIDSKWLAEHKINAINALKHDLVFTPHPDRALFYLTMTTSDPTEAAMLLNGALKVYANILLDESNRKKEAGLKKVSDALKQANVDFTGKANSFEDFARQYYLAGPVLADEPRVQQLFDDPEIPDKPVVPPWYWYLPTGAGGGAILSALLLIKTYRQRKE